MLEYPAHADLIRDIDTREVSPSTACLWWLGQHSFVIKTATAILYVDPFLSDHGKRRIPPLLAPEDITHANIIVGTHDHRDHIDREIWPILAEASPQAHFIVPEFHRQRLMDELHLPPERIQGIEAGGSLEHAGIRLHGVPAAHEFLDRDPETGRYPFLGVVITTGNCHVYHAGDTCPYEGMLDFLRPFSLAAALLPINGRDAERLARNCIGNMTFQEAADLAGALRPGLTLPTHFDMFLGNMEDPRKFTDYMRVKYPHLATRIPAYGIALPVGIPRDDEPHPDP